MESRSRGNSIIRGTLVLSAASVITRLLGFIYRIYIVDSIGAEGMGLYQLIMPIYNLAWAISCSGFTTTISRLVAQENAKKQYGNMGRVLKQSLVLTTLISVILTLIMFFGADFIGTSIIGDERTVLSLRILSAAIPFMAAGSCIRGYFNGVQEQAVPASSQVLEQCIRMGVIYALAGILVPLGLEYACAAAVIGVFFGETISFAYMVVAYKKFKRGHGFTGRPTLSSQKLLTVILAMAIPLALNRICGSLLSTVEDFLIPMSLQKFGMSSTEAISTFGRVTGMAMPLVYFPSAFLTSLSISLVPSISEDVAMHNTRRMEKTTEVAVQMTALLAMAASMIFLVFPDEIGQIIYKQDIGRILFTLGIMSPFLYIGPTLHGVLHGLGEQFFIFRNSLLSSAINIACIYFLVPIYGVDAFIGGWTVSLIIVTILDLMKVRKCTGMHLRLGDWFLKPVLAAAASALTVEYLANHYIIPQFGGFFGVILGVVLMELMYLTFALMMGCVKRETLRGVLKLS